jgi:hypothetical protein
VDVPSADPSQIRRWTVTSHGSDEEPTIRGPRPF